MEIIKTTRKGIVHGEYLFIKDNAKVFEGDGFYLDVFLDWDTDTGTFSKPSSMFGCPQPGDIIDQKMSSGKILRSIVTSYTQDYDWGKGTIHILFYKEEFNKMVNSNKRLIV